MAPLPPPKCGIVALFLPLIHTKENAFNPCFISLLVLIWSLVFGIVAANSLFRSIQKPRHGNISPKNTGLFHWLRCFLVLLHTLCMGRLFWSISVVERFADTKFPSFAVLYITLVFLVTPLHFIETTRSLVPLGVLLIFWPGIAIIDTVLLFQDLYTKWPVFLFELAPSWELFAVVTAVAVFYMESSRSTWKPSHALLLHYRQTYPKASVYGPPNFMEKITFSWMNPLVTNSYVNQTVKHDDLPESPDHLNTKNYTKQLQKHLDLSSLEKSSFDLFIAIVKAFGPVATVSFMYEAGDSLLAFVQPQLLRLLIVFMGDKMKDPLQPVLRGFMLCMGMFGVTLLQTVLNNQYVLKVLEVGLGCRSSLTSLIFQKSIHLSAHSRSERSSGDIVNLVSIDAPRVQTCAQEISTLIIAPTELVLSIWSLYNLLGRSAFAGLFVMLIFVPINTFFVRYLKKLNKVQMKLKDNRNRITNEILVSMKSIKLYSWEAPMLKRLFEARNDKELRNSKRIRIVNQCGNLIWTTMPFLVSFLTFAIFALVEKRPLTSEIVFPGLTLLNILSRPILLFPSVITYITEAVVALERISAFLSAPEVDPKLIEVGSANEGDSLDIKNTSFLWEKPRITETQTVAEDDDFTGHKYALRGINMKVCKGEFVCVVGRVGSGKSSFLSSILGQLDAVDSVHPSVSPRSVKLNGTIGYCSQNPWIMNASVKENITFGHKFDESYYEQTIEACQLLPDLKILPDGDETQVGEKGISLSGGQKARLSLARAVYSRADIYLLDDILSAVDSHVGRNITSKVLTKGGLLSGKTIIFATNSIPVLEHADKIYLFERGKITERAPFSEAVLGNLHPQLNSLVAEFGNYSSRSQSPEADEIEESLEDTVKIVKHRKASLAPLEWNPFKQKATRRTGNTVEVSAKGSVKTDVYIDYIKACSVSGMLLWVGLFVVATIASISTNYWLKKWSETNSDIGDNSQALHFIAIYAILGFSTSALNLLKGVVFFVFMSIRGGRTIHDRMAKRLMKAPMNFFERTPVGRIMNRFSNDINKVDSALPRSLNIYMGSLLSTVSTIVVVAMALPVYLIVVVLLGFIYGYYQKYYISVQRELKRLVSISRSPIFAHFQESLNGVETIRAYRQEERFNFINNGNVDFNMRSLFMLRSINRWLSVRLQFIGSLVIWSSSTLLIYKSTTASPIGAGMAGFVMSYALQVTDTFKKMVRMSAEVEANIVSVERCLEYCVLPTEEDENTTFIEPPTGWPQHGAIDIKNYSTRYAKNLDLVLKDISLKIEAGEKIGVVGRTGAGKSSLVLAIFRMIPAVDGAIFIDGINTAKTSLFDLRHNLSIIPQDSHLFEGTLRQNLDPFGEYSDDKLWKVLAHSNLKETVKELGEGLDSQVKEGGSNFSVGQRQLMCLGRALLNPSRFLMLDEATAAVDVQTDKIIQSTIRKEFREKTIVTIAHRLDTVMDCDRILGLDHGEVKEFDAPEKLLKDPNGIFYNLCKQGNYI